MDTTAIFYVKRLKKIIIGKNLFPKLPIVYAMVMLQFLKGKIPNAYRGLILGLKELLFLMFAPLNGSISSDPLLKHGMMDVWRYRSLWMSSGRGIFQINIP